eukprot:CAMPEP_0168352602 /NCGR_PEP_ID=MMETSP0213-20121227/22689_1 /TAXON_ID=151035 /ORGANISM="Euplotes harpa, Strain FSP1.4" /LENGTH=96 /DNA_ID=CAMNT_0008363925 /DNA_START=475 /DNA_END=765 /DNA_ORIENTATION=+
MYRNIKTGEHIPNCEGKSLTGTARYASLNAHLGYEQRLLALGYVLVYLLKGTLPWSDIRAKSKKEKYEMIRDRKLETTTEELCSECPNEFVKYFTY